MSKYQVSLNRIKSIDLDVVRANMWEMRLGVSPYMVYDLPNLEMSKDINILQEAINKAKAFDVLMSILNNDTFIMDTENYNKSIQIKQNYNTIEIPISDEDFETLERAMEEDKIE